MGFFKKWLLKETKVDMFSQRDITQQSNISALLGFSKPLVKLSQGSIATLYQHPNKNNLLIKVTAHHEDAENIIKAQKLKSNNIVKAFPWKNGEMIKDIPSINSKAIIVEKLLASPMVYTTSDFFDLSLNGQFELAADWLDYTLHKKQKLILDNYNKNNFEEHRKLSDLFKTLFELEKFYRIELSDFEDNIIDSKNDYIVVDMGF